MEFRIFLNDKLWLKYYASRDTHDDYSTTLFWRIDKTFAELLASVAMFSTCPYKDKAI